MKISLFTKIDKPTVKECIEYVKGHFNSVSVYQGKVGNPFPLEAYNNSPDIVFSYLSPWIIPPKILNKTKLWNINFHPAPPEYPGIGCFNFALYNNEKMFGVAAHHMEEKVDTGKMIAVKRFPIVDSDAVYSLSIKSYSALFLLFIEFQTTGGVINSKHEIQIRRKCLKLKARVFIPTGWCRNLRCCFSASVIRICFGFRISCFEFMTPPDV